MERRQAKNGHLVRNPSLTDWLWLEGGALASGDLEGVSAPPPVGSDRGLVATEGLWRLPWALVSIQLITALYFLGAGTVHSPPGWYLDAALTLACLGLFLSTRACPSAASARALHHLPLEVTLSMGGWTKRRAPRPPAAAFARTTPTFDRVFLALFVALGASWAPAMGYDLERLGGRGRETPAAARAGGALLFASGWVLMVVTARNRIMGGVQEEKEVVASGIDNKAKLLPYVRRKISHPMFLGGCAVALGAPLFLGSWIGVGVGTVIGASLYIRALQEEAVNVNFARLPPVPQSPKSPTSALRQTFSSGEDVITRIA